MPGSEFLLFLHVLLGFTKVVDFVDSYLAKNSPGSRLALLFGFVQLVQNLDVEEVRIQKLPKMN